VLTKELKIMPYKENLRRAKVLKVELDKLRPLSPEMEKRIMQKFRLDWNYHSSHIEGNALTYGETKALILFGHTAQAKPFKDHLEMSGHDEAIKYIEEVIKQERPLTENFIRELHELILKEPYEVNAITPDGKHTKKLVQVGKYKTTPNHIQTKTGEIFYFTSPEETPAKMQDLMIWYNDNQNKPETDPVLFATEFHYLFIRIHPFDDGNGRIARLLMNFILMQKGYPPAIIKTEDKNNYYNALQQADTGQIEYFFNYICLQVIHSLDLMIKGAKGEEIEELDDFDKKLALLKSEIESADSLEYGEERNSNNIKDLTNKLLKPLFNSLYDKLSKLEPLFTKSLIIISLDNSNNKILKNNDLSFLDDWQTQMLNGKELSFIINYKELIKARPGRMTIAAGIDFFFEKYYYELRNDLTDTFYRNGYKTLLNEDEIKILSSKIGSKVLIEIEQKWNVLKARQKKAKDTRSI
jgi:Fic family protein